jgi:hypothetical protein
MDHQLTNATAAQEHTYSQELPVKTLAQMELTLKTEFEWAVLWIDRYATKLDALTEKLATSWKTDSEKVTEDLATLVMTGSDTLEIKIATYVLENLRLNELNVNQDLSLLTTCKWYKLLNFD